VWHLPVYTADTVGSNEAYAAPACSEESCAYDLNDDFQMQKRKTAKGEQHPQIH
jgi:hypothetical protein